MKRDSLIRWFMVLGVCAVGVGCASQGKKDQDSYQKSMDDSSDKKDDNDNESEDVCELNSAQNTKTENSSQKEMKSQSPVSLEKKQVESKSQETAAQ